MRKDFEPNEGQFHSIDIIVLLLQGGTGFWVLIEGIEFNETSGSERVFGFRSLFSPPEHLDHVL
jgi:hypothetical protein